VENLLLIVGPTAVGKSKLGLYLAKKFNGEIISADSMQVYKGMDIGTAKVPANVRREIKHHLIDILEPTQNFSVKKFQELASKKILDITARNKLPILVGGSCLYIDALVFSYKIPIVYDLKYRERLYKIAKLKGNLYLYRFLKSKDPKACEKIHVNDTKRIIRALEVYKKTKKKFSDFAQKNLKYNTLWLGLTMQREKLYKQIDYRVDEMIKNGFIAEVRELLKKGFDSKLTSMQAIGYKEIVAYLNKQLSLEEAIYMIKKNTRNYAKRQLSWFKRIKEIVWFDITNPSVLVKIEDLVAGKFFK